MPQITSAYQWEPVAIPLVAGLDLNFRARLVDKLKLLKAENVHFPRGGGPEIRRGHRAIRVTDATISIPPSTVPPDENLFGYGLFDASNPPAHTAQNSEISSYPGSGEIRGLYTRDDEVVSWDGHRMFTYHPGDDTFTQLKNDISLEGVAPYTPHAHGVIPTARTETIAKTSFAQNYSDLGDNGVVRVVATKNTVTGIVHVFCYDSESGSLKFTDTLGLNDAQFIRVVPVGAFVHIYVDDSALNELFVYTVHQDQFEVSSAVSLGECVDVFDVEKVNESLTLVGKKDAGDAILLTYVNANGTVNNTYFAANFEPDLGLTTAVNFGLCVHPTSLEICLFWSDATQQYARVYNSHGAALTAANLVDTLTDVKHLTCTPTYLVHANGSAFYLFLDNVTTSSYVKSYLHIANTSPTLSTLHNVNLASRAFRVGNLGMVHVCYPTTLQTQYLLVDQGLLMRGRLEYGTAINNTTDPWLPTVNYRITDEKWNITDFHCALMYRLRILSQNTNPPTTSAVFQETSTKHVVMNFLPKLVTAQAGRSTYIAGSLLWMYDGRELTESGFIAGPEDFTMASSAAGGSMVTGNVYRYRIYACHKNAQGEEVRSVAFLSNTTTVGVGHNRVVITGKYIPTHRKDAYFLVYRNENAGTLWYLVSNRDPASTDCPKNVNTSGTWTFTDTLADASIINRELDPANNTLWLAPWTAPSCERVYFGKNRLWISGGEITPGEIWGSRLSINESYTFNPVLAVSVDKDKQQIEAIGFTADYTVAFKKNVVYILAGDFSSNIFTGNSISTQLALSEIGAVSPYVARLNTGCVFQSAGGFRLIQPGGGIQSIGTDVDSLSGNLAGIVVSYGDRNIRFYQSDNQSCVMDYETGDWTTFTVQPTAAVVGPDGLARIGVGNKLFIETEDLYTDDSRSYNARVRSSWLGANLGGFMKVRRVGAIGEFYEHSTVQVNVYQDEEEGWVQTFTWNTEDDLNTSTWGSDSWGSGFWGDSGGTGFAARDSVWRFRRRLNVTKCSAISLELVFDSSYGKAVVPTAFLLEIGNKNTLDRIPTR